ncbi:MOSC domain-containing protein [Novosphingobium sp. THN1]|uniref:MOSC domain-containing protein n=1 Tax=Novosphingobium sp. THN1 TaxID=1016987 RepID=UPI000E4B530F|nr:MOSC domain-containing protein [Novosphingobium sp. THN1]AXU19765.1 MOSC domain-containing protein [Novosphingobium sp. THN1]
MSGRLEGIARHDRPSGPIETLDHVSVTRELGVRGDLRGAIRPGKSGRRQISLIEAESWDAALADLKLSADQLLPWHVRRANLLVHGIRLPREAGKIIAIGKSLRIETTCECDPCSRMDQILPGLKLALMPDWRGGVLGRVLTDGEIAIGDEVRIEE